MTIDSEIAKIPVWVIRVKGSSICNHYLPVTVNSWRYFGFSDINLFDACTPDNWEIHEYYSKLPPISFAEKRIYRTGRSRRWVPTEKQIWMSHYSMWHKCIELDTPIFIIEHDCRLVRPFQNGFNRGRNLFSFGMATDKKNLAGLGYFITPEHAKRMFTITGNRVIVGPVDGYIHASQPWYPRGLLDDKYIKEHIYAKHLVNEEVGTTKPTVRKRKKNG